MATYRVLYCPVLAPHDIQGELQAIEVEWGHTLNGAGSAEITLPLVPSTSTPLLTGQVVGPSFSMADVRPGSTAVYVERNGALVWGGIVWTARMSIIDDVLELGAEGFWSYYRHRLVQGNNTFVATDQATIVSVLLNDVATISGDIGNIGLDLSGITPTGVLRDRSYEDWERKEAAEAVEQLAAVEDGFDFRVDTSWGPGGAPLNRFLLEYPAGGRSVDVVLELGRNVSELEVTDDATGMSNMVAALGSGEGEARAEALVFAYEAPWPILQAVHTFPDVSVPATLTAHATLEALRGRYPLLAAHATLAPGAEPDLSELLVGDVVALHAVRGYLEVVADFRIVGIGVHVDEQGNEEVSLDLASTVLFE